MELMSQEDFDRRRLELYKDEDSGCYILCEGHTEEKFYLDPGEWTLQFSHLGAFVVDATGLQKPWVDDLLQFTVSVDKDADGDAGDNVVVLVGEDVMSLGDFSARYTADKHGINFFGDQQTDLPVYLLRQCVAGAWGLWGLAAIYRAVIGEKKTTAQSWYQGWWSWWSKGLDKRGAPQFQHLRKAWKTDHTTVHNEAEIDRHRMPEASMSTFGLVHHFARWSSPSPCGKEKDGANMEKWSIAFDAFIDRFVTQEQAAMEWSVCVDPAVELRLGLPPSGLDRVRLP